MTYQIAYTVFLLIELVVSFSIAAYIASLLFSSVMGAPYVPSSQKNVEETLRAAKLKKNQIFLELGSGDGRVTRTAVKLYGVKATGIDINPILVFYSRILAKINHIGNRAVFVRKNIFDINLGMADVLYQFLMPEMIKKLYPKYLKEIKKGTMVISHGFEIYGWEKYLTQKIERDHFSTYFYVRT